MGRIKMFKIIHDAETGKIEKVDLTKEEIATLEKDRLETLAEMEAMRIEAEAKAAAKAPLLEKLGITAEEAKLLLS
jgi:hypothetical protein